MQQPPLRRHEAAVAQVDSTPDDAKASAAKAAARLIMFPEAFLGRCPKALADQDTAKEG